MPEEPGQLEGGGDPGPVVVGTGTAKDGVVVPTDDDDLLGMVPPRELGFQVSNRIVRDRERLTFGRIAELDELVLDVVGGGNQVLVPREVPLADLGGEHAEVPHDVVADLTFSRRERGKRAGV